MNCGTREPGSSAQALAQIRQLEAHLQSHLGRRIQDLQLSFRDNGLILRGNCHTYYAKQLAQHAVMRASPCPILANEIEVR